MKQFDDLFTSPASPDREIEPHEHVLNQIRSLDGERCYARSQLCMNQLNITEAGNIGNVIPEQGVIGGQFDPHHQKPMHHHCQPDKILPMLTL